MITLNLIDKTRLLFKNNLNDYIKAFLRGDDVSGDNSISIDSETAMKYSAVFACVRVLSETLASLPVFVYKRSKTGDKIPTSDISAYDLLHHAPNPETTPFAFKEALMMNICTGGNGYAYKAYNRFDEIVQLKPIDWQQVRVERDKETKALVYWVRNGSVEEKMSREQILHIPGMSFNGFMGLTPLEYAAESIRLGLTYERFGINFYKNGANSSGVLSHPGTLKPEAFKRLKDDFAKNYQGLANTGRPIILEDGMTFKEITIKQSDAQFLESRKFQLEDVARIYRVPLHLIQNLDRATNNNIEHQSLEFVMYTMLPWVKRWEENLNLQLLSQSERKAGYFTEIKVDALLRGDTKSRADAYSTGRQWGWLSVNDIRRLENMNPIENGDVYLQPMNMVEAGTKIDNDDSKKLEAEQIQRMIERR